MLGFSAYAQTPYSQAVTSLGANAFLTGGAPGTSSAGTFSFIQVANKTIAAVVGSVSVNSFADVEGESNPNLTGTASTGVVSAFTSVTGKAASTLSASTATGSTGSVTTKGEGGASCNTLGVKTFSLGTLDVTGKANATLSNVLGDISVGALEGPAIEEDIVSVSATISAGSLVLRGRSDVTTQGVVATTINKVMSLQAKAQTTISSVQGTTNVSLEPDAQATADATGVSATYSFNKPTQTAVQKVYSNTDYVQSSVVTIHTTVKNKIVYVRK